MFFIIAEYIRNLYNKNLYTTIDDTIDDTLSYSVTTTVYYSTQEELDDLV